MAEIRPPYTADLDSGIRRTYLNTIFATGDSLANCFAVQLFRGNTAFTIPSGATVKGYFVRQKDNSTIELSGTKSGNVASVTLNSACYNQSGPFTLTIKVLEGSAVTTVFYGEGSMSVSRTGNTVNPSFEAVEYYKHPVNLLDNSKFEIAQAGYNGKHGSTTYACDRWAASGSTVVTKTASGLLISSGGAIRQKLTGLAGKTLTFALKGTAGATKRLNFMNADYSGVQDHWFTGEIGILTYTVPSNTDAMWLHIGVPGTDGATIEWAALYDGAYTSETLPPYRPKGYAVELAECLRYFAYAGRYYSRAYSRYYLYNSSMIAPFPMRAEKPSVIVRSPSTNADYKIYQSGVGDISDFTVATDSNRSAVLVSPNGGFVPNEEYTWHAFFDADL